MARSGAHTLIESSSYNVGMAVGVRSSEKLGKFFKCFLLTSHSHLVVSLFFKKLSIFIFAVLSHYN